MYTHWMGGILHMNHYESRYERAHGFRAVVKLLLVIGVLLCIFIFGGIYFSEYMTEQHLEVTQTTFSDLERDHFEYKYGFALADDLEPRYTFRQDFSGASSKYSGIVLDVKTDFGSMLENCMHLNPDGEDYLNIYNNCRDYFIDGDYKGPLEKIQTDDGRKKALHFSISGNKYQYFIFSDDNGGYQLLARREN